MAKTVQVVASATGFDGLSIRNQGDVFAVPESAAKKFSSWFKPVDEKFKVDPEPVRKSPATVNDELDDLKQQVAQLTALLTGKVKAKVKPDDQKPGDPESLV